MYILSVSTFSLNSSFSLLKKENNSLKNIIEFNLYYSNIDNQSQLSIFPYFLKLIKEKVGIDLREIKEVLVLRGPGFFTSLRIGAIVSQTLAFINNADLYSIDTFKAVLNILYYFYKDYINPKNCILVIIKVSNSKFKILKLNDFHNKINQEHITEINDISKNELQKLIQEYSDNLDNSLIIVSPNMELDEIIEIENLGIIFIDLRDIFTSSNVAKASFYLNNLKKEDPSFLQLTY